MRTKILIFLMIIICACGRNGNQKNDGTIRVIDLFSEPESEITQVSDVATDIDYIPLQTTKNSLIKSITKIVTCDDKIYVKTNLDNILCFNREGNFLYDLNKSGRGPGEYSYIVDFDISSDNKTLLILSIGKVLIFNNTGKEFIFNKSINLRQPFPSKISMIPLTLNILLSMDPSAGNERALSLLINMDGDTLNFKPNLYKSEKVDKFIQMINESLHYDFGNGVCFKEEFSDTVFFVNKETNKFQPRLIFDSHGKGVSPSVRYNKEYARNNGAEIYWVYLIIETPRYIIYTYEHNRSRNKMIYDKSFNKKFKIALKDALKDDINGGPVFDPNFCSESNVYSSIDALTLKKYVTGEEFKNARASDPRKKIELKKLADSLSETDNPVLIVVTPKE